MQKIMEYHEEFKTHRGITPILTWETELVYLDFSQIRQVFFEETEFLFSFFVI